MIYTWEGGQKGPFQIGKGMLIHVDPNAAYNLIRKVFPEAFVIDRVSYIQEV